MSGTAITSWNFNALSIAGNLNPAPSLGSGTASSVGMQSTGTVGVSPYPTPNATGPDASAITAASGSSSDGTTGNIWKIVGTNGWNHNAAIASQGAQFAVDTTGYTNVNLQFDWGVSSTKANGLLAVEYTTNINAATPTWVIAPSIGIPAADTLTTTVTNPASGGSANTIVGTYFRNIGSSTWQNGLTADFSSVTAANNNPNFGVRIVNAATGADARDGSNTTTAPSDTSANWRLDEVQILGVPAGAVAPTITTNPGNVTTNGGNSVSFNAAASGTAPVTVQWQVSTNTVTPSYTNISGATSTTYTIASAGTANNGLYRAVFSNVAGSATTSAATLTIPTTTTITVQPTNQTANVPNAVTFSATGFGPTAPVTVQWQIKTSGSSSFTNVSGGTAVYNTATGVATYSFTPAFADTGDQFQAIFTSGGTSVTTSPATLTVFGAPVTAWTFPATATSPINLPNPVPAVGTGSLVPLGMTNDYTGVDSQPEDDITSSPTVAGDFTFSENTFRVRGGSGAGATGSAGSPDGWSGFAPSGTQGIQFNVPTSGVKNPVLHFDWYSTTSGAKTAQIQYTTDGSTWLNYGSPIVANSNDFYGANPTTAPTGVTINLQGISGVDDNSNFAVRMVSIYQPTDYSLSGTNADNALPQIYDGNLLINDGNGNPVYHGQYATADPTQGAYTSQEIQIGGSSLSGTFTLTIGGETTAPITYDAGYTLGGTVSNLATAIQTKLSALPGYTGSKAVVVTSLDGIASNFLIQFKSAQTGAITANSSLSGSHNSASNTDPSVNVIYAGSLIPYTTTGSGNWRFGNIALTGQSVNGTPQILSDPVSQIVSLPAGGGSTSVLLTASAYSETGLSSVQWEVSTDGGNSFNPVASGGTTFNTSGNVYSSSYQFVAASTSQNGYEFKAVFTNGNGSASTTNATMLVVIPTAPTFTLPGEPGTTATVSGQPTSASAIAGSSALFTAEVIGLPFTGSSTVWNFSTNNGATWQAVTLNSVNTMSTTIVNLTSGYQTSTSVLSIQGVLAQSGYEYQAVVTNAAGVATSNAVTLNVLNPEPVITQWNFGGNNSTGVVASPDNSPTPNINTAPGTLNSLGFDDPNFPSVTADDVTSTAGTINTSYAENTWRIRGGSDTSHPGSPANGWDYLAPQYSQGAQIDINTTNLQNIYVTFDWYTTAQGVRDLQEQYSLNTAAGTPVWVNINQPLIAVSGADFYGTTNATTAPTGALLDLTQITGANNNPNFGIRLVAAWDPYFGYDFTDSQSVINNNNLNTPEPRGQYASATLVNGNPVPLNGSSGNWRFGNISVSGVVSTPAWLSPASITSGGATWNAATETLTVTGTASIIGDPAASGDLPNITVSGAAAELTIDPGTTRTVNIAGLSINGGAVVNMPAGATSHILIVAAGSGDFSIDSSSKLDLGNNYIDFQDATSSDGLARLGTITPELQAGFNNGLWSGLGITSSTAQNDATHLTSLGIILNNGIYGTGAGSLGTFDTVNPGTYDVLVRYTYFGDANLDGRVDASDYSDIDSGFVAGGVSSWINGNFNYDGTVNGSDYTLIDNAFNRQGARLLAETASQIAKPADQTSVSWNTAYGTQSANSISDLWKHDKANSLAGTLLDLLNQPT